MPRGVPLTDDIKLDICELIEKGLPAKDIARQLHISVHSVSRVKQDFYGKEHGMGMVIAGDKKHGTLTHESGTTYIGTCLTSNGRMKKRRFIAQNSREAEEKWTQWKNDCNGNKYSLATNSSKPKEEPVADETDSVPVLTMKDGNLKIGLKTPIYILVIDDEHVVSTIGYSQNIVGYFVSQSEAEKVANTANHFVARVTHSHPYKVVEVRPYSDTTLDLHTT